MVASTFPPTGAWNPAKVKAFRAAFEAFLRVVKIDSKETGGGTVLADRIYDAQRIVLDAIFEGLSNDVHSFDILKSRQLGVSTITRALIVFWLGFFQGMKGGLVFDTGDHKEEARRDIEMLIDALPDSINFPKIRTRNRSMLILDNGSTLLFMAAGVKKGKSSGTLGRGSGLNLLWVSEHCSFDNDEGIKSLESSIAKEFTDRLYVWESTARGPNIRKEIWENARADELRWRAIFVGWWAHPGQRLLRGTPAFEKYSAAPLSPLEKRRIKEVKELYGWDVTIEQLAWYRRQVDPNAEGDDDHREYIDDDLTRQDQPWTEHEAFVLSGSTFFPSDPLNDLMKTTVNTKYTGYKFYPGTDFLGTRVEQVRSAREIMLKVWEDPVPHGEYVLSFDVAFGHNEDNDRSAFQILRCYADRIEQVAEFASASTPTDHYAWCILHCVAWYKNVLMIGELNGPGESVFKSYTETLKLIKSGYLRGAAKEAGISDAFNNVRNFIYSRPDSMTNGNVWHFKCLSLDTPLPTPTGWTTMGDVQEGETLFDENGRPCTVMGVSPIHVDKECFRVTFEDKSSIVSDADHLWKVVVRNGHKSRENSEWLTLKTRDLIAGRHLIQAPKPLETEPIDLPINPYVLGVWLGDGAAACNRFWAHIDDMEEISGHLRDCGRELSEVAADNRNPNVLRRTIVGLTQELRSQGLLNNKHIPPAYLRASYDQRLSLLQGLMDTDGTLTLKKSGATNQASFHTSNAALSSGVAELIRSLGMKANHIVHTPWCDYKGERRLGKTAYRYYFTPYEDICVFRLKRKQDRISNAKIRRPGVCKFYKITSVDPVQSVPVKCVQVDSPSHLFLAGDGMIPTHNTTAQLKVTIFERLRDNVVGDRLGIASMDTLREMKDIIRSGDEIRGEGKTKDDRAFALALGSWAWHERVRGRMSQANRTKAAEIAKHRQSLTDQYKLFSQNTMQAFFAGKERARKQAARAERMASRRGRY